MAFYLTDGTYLMSRVVGQLATIGWDNYLGGNTLPLGTTQLDRDTLARLLGRDDLVTVTLDQARADVPIEDQGAGGTGTSRAWLELEYASGTQEKVFVKLPAPSLVERMFLSIFGVYRNELNFYSNIVGLAHAPRDLFCKPHLVRTEGARFILVLEDLGSRNCLFPSITGEYTFDQARIVLRSLATMHAAFWNRPPAGCWTDDWSAPRTDPPSAQRTRPYWLRVIAETTLKKLLKRIPGILAPEIVVTYKRFIEHFEEIRRYWSTEGALTMVHGDCHAGNMFFNQDGTSGFLDMQCVAAEQSMRDVVYHLTSVFDPEELAQREQGLVREYLELLNPKLAARDIEPLSFDDAWFQYRLHSLWALAAFVISAGASELMEAGVAGVTIPKIAAAVDRLDAAGAMDQALATVAKYQ